MAKFVNDGIRLDRIQDVINSFKNCFALNRCFEMPFKTIDCNTKRIAFSRKCHGNCMPRR